MSDQAQRVTTTEDNEDQEALNVVSCAVGARWYARHILARLSAAGYTVVKTEWEYGVEIGPDVFSAVKEEYARERQRLNGWRIARRLSCLVDAAWEPVPGSDTLGGLDG